MATSTGKTRRKSSKAKAAGAALARSKKKKASKAKKKSRKKVVQKASGARKTASRKKSGAKKTTSSKTRSRVLSKKVKPLKISKPLAKKIYGLMVKSRVLEERMIQVYRKGEAYFWIGAPGEEAFGVPLGLLSKPGQGPQYDYFHLHYRATPTLLAMGMDPKDALRLIMNRSTDPCTGGRNFSNHYCYPAWNVVPVSSPIEVQYSVAIGTGLSQRRNKSKGVSIITGGDAGSAEGDFASCLIWASRPGAELPLYITVQNNKWGISTSYDTQHGEKHVSDRGKAFGIRDRVYNGNDPEEAYLGIQDDLAYIRKTGKPVIAEFRVARLYGHSSASGANRIPGEVDCLETFEKRLVDTGVLKANESQKIWQSHFQEIQSLADEVRDEPSPQSSTLWDHTYAGSENADWRNF